MRGVVALLLLGVCGCASQPFSPQGDLVVANRVGAASPAAEKPIDLCAQVRAEEGIAADEVGGVRFLCALTAAGAWAVEIAPPVGDTADLALVILHADRSGARARSVTPIAGGAVWWPTLAPLARGATVFDFDGDGEPELFVRLTRIGFTEVRVQQVFLTVHAGAIVDYAPASALAIEGFEDVDGDGRPDARLEPHRYAHARSDGSFWLEKPRLAHR